MTEFTFDFACRDDCLDRMVPSDLRQIIAERDRLRKQVAILEQTSDFWRAKLVNSFAEDFDNS